MDRCVCHFRVPFQANNVYMYCVCLVPDLTVEPTKFGSTSALGEQFRAMTEEDLEIPIQWRCVQVKVYALPDSLLQFILVIFVVLFVGLLC